MASLSVTYGLGPVSSYTFAFSVAEYTAASAMLEKYAVTDLNVYNFVVNSINPALVGNNLPPVPLPTTPPSS